MHTRRSSWSPGAADVASFQDVTPEILFYDGHCGLCHGFVKFVLARDPHGVAFRFAPIDGETFQASVSEEQRRDAADSIAVLTGSGQLLWGADAMIQVFRRLGGRIVYAIDDLDAWAALGTRRSTSDPGNGVVHPAKRLPSDCVRR